MALAVSGCVITDETTTITIHNETSSLQVELKHSSSNRLEKAGDLVTIGARKNKLIRVDGKLQDVPAGLTADGQKNKLEEWLESGTTVYLKSSVVNSTSTYSGVTHSFGGAYYLPILILKVTATATGGSTEFAISLEIEEVVSS